MPTILGCYEYFDRYPNEIKIWDWLQRIIDNPEESFVYSADREWDWAWWVPRKDFPRLQDLFDAAQDSIKKHNTPVTLVFGSQGLVTDDNGNTLVSRPYLDVDVVEWKTSFFNYGSTFIDSVDRYWEWGEKRPFYRLKDLNYHWHRPGVGRPGGYWSKYSCLMNAPHAHRAQLMRDILAHDPELSGQVTWCSHPAMWKDWISGNWQNKYRLRTGEHVTKDCGEDLISTLSLFANRLSADMWFPGIGQERLNQQQLPLYWDKCFVDIVSESSSVVNFYTEKTVRPIVMGKPFIICGAPGANNYLKNLGFELFEELFDYSAEPSTANTVEESYSFYHKLIAPLFSLTLQDCRELAETWAPKLLHNQKVWKDIVMSDEHLPEVLKQDLLAPQDASWKVSWDIPSLRQTLTEHFYWSTL